jgi:uncharacterized membrane protein YdjX (TVP38/TMEM64 family)
VEDVRPHVLDLSAAAVLLLPGLVLSLGAGAVFGMQLGLLAVWLGATIGETIAFLLGRYIPVHLHSWSELLFRHVMSD